MRNDPTSPLHPQPLCLRCWAIQCSLHQLTEARPHADRTLYAVHPIPLSEVKAIRKHAPSFGTQHVVLVLSNGLTLPPLYFTNGGVKGLFSALREVRCLCVFCSAGQCIRMW